MDVPLAMDEDGEVLQDSIVRYALVRMVLDPEGELKVDLVSFSLF